MCITGVETPAATNASGVYSIRFLPIGQYEVTVKASGFGTQTIPPFSLEIDQTANVQRAPDRWATLRRQWKSRLRRRF